MNEVPEPEQKPAPEIRGGDRPSDYIEMPPGAAWAVEDTEPEDEGDDE